MSRKLVVVLPDGNRRVLGQVRADDEHQLQERLKDDPELLPVDELGLTGVPIVVGRETQLPSGAIDLLLLDRTGTLCLVEFKTGPQNPDFRACLAQLMDYGSDLWGMAVEDFEHRVAVRYFTGPHCPPGAIGHGQTSIGEAAAQSWPPDSAQDADPFDWRDGLTSQLLSGGFCYVVVAQRFAPQTLTTIRYLNASMPQARFHAVELVRFDSDDALGSGSVGAYETRHLVGPERVRGPAGERAKALANSAELLSRVEDDAYRTALESLIASFEQIDRLTIFYGTTGISLRVAIPGGKQVSVGWFFPPGPPRWLGLTHLTLGYYTIGLVIESIRGDALAAYASAVAVLPGAKPAIKPTFNASTFGPSEVSESGQHLLAAVEDVTTALLAP
jgi:hypothetical protein